MNIERLKEIRDGLTGHESVTLKTKEIKDLILEQSKNGDKTIINEYFHLIIEDVAIALDFEKQQHLILPF